MTFGGVYMEIKDLKSARRNAYDVGSLQDCFLHLNIEIFDKN